MKSKLRILIVSCVGLSLFGAASCRSSATIPFPPVEFEYSYHDSMTMPDAIYDLFRAIDRGDDRQAVINRLAADPRDQEGAGPLHWAVRIKHTEMVRDLLQYGADGNAMDNNGRTPLHDAAKYGLIEEATILLDHGVNIDAALEVGNTALYSAVHWKHPALVNLLLKNGADLNRSLNQGWTPLLAAVQQNDHARVLQLIEAGADVNAHSGGQVTPLFYAAKQGYTEIIELLLSHGTRVNPETKGTRTALFMALAEGWRQSANVLRDHGGILFSQPKGLTPVLAALKEGNQTAAVSEVNALLAKKKPAPQGGQPGRSQPTPLSALHWAVSQSRLPLVKLLVEHGAYVNNKTYYYGWTPLHVAVALDDENVARYLIDQMSASGLGKSSYRLLLGTAAHLGSEQCVKLLLESGADPNGENNSILGSPLYLACERSHFGIAKTLVEHGARVNSKTSDRMTSLHAAAANGVVEIAQYLIEQGADLNAQGKDGNTPLHQAVENGHLSIVKLLHEAGANLTSWNSVSDSPLHLAVRQGNVEIATYLLNNGVELDCSTSKSLGQTPLYRALEVGRLDLAEFLLKQGASPKPGKRFSKSLLFQRVEKEDVDGIRLLLRYGASVNQRFSDSGTALSQAASIGQVRIAKILIDAGANVDATGGGQPLLRAAIGYSEINAKMLLKDKYLKVAQLLLEHNADPSVAYQENGTPLEIVSKRGINPFVELLVDHDPEWIEGSVLNDAASRGDEELVRYFLEKGCSVYGSGSTPLHHAATNPKSLAIAEWFLDRGAFLDARAANNETPLLRAIRSKNPKMASLLIARGADVTATTKNGSSPLYLAVQNQMPLYLVQALLDRGADPNGWSYASQSLLSKAIRNEPVARILILAGAEVNPPGAHGGGLLLSAIDNKLEDLAILLIEKGAPVNTKVPGKKSLLRIAAKHGLVQVVRALIEKGADVNFQEKNDNTILQEAVLNEQLEVVALLLESGADPNFKLPPRSVPATHRRRGQPSPKGNTIFFELISEGRVEVAKIFLKRKQELEMVDSQGRTPLHVAAEHGQLKTCQLLVREKLDMNAKDGEGQTPLHMAATGGFLEIVNYSIAQGADIHAKTRDGETVLHRAARFPPTIHNNEYKKNHKLNSLHGEIVELLIEQGADPNTRATDWRTPLHVAATFDNKNAAEALLAKGADINAKT